jgi:glycerol-3-phosphate O-acyltransferase
MSAAETYQWWFVWLGVAGVIVAAAAALLVTIALLARRIGALAATALEVVEQIEKNTKPIWQLNTTNKVAKELLGGAQAIEANAGAVVGALTAADRRRAA